MQSRCAADTVDGKPKSGAKQLAGYETIASFFHAGKSEANSFTGQHGLTVAGPIAEPNAVCGHDANSHAVSDHAADANSHAVSDADADSDTDSEPYRIGDNGSSDEPDADVRKR